MWLNKWKYSGLLALLVLSMGTAYAKQPDWNSIEHDPFGLQQASQSSGSRQEILISVPGEYIMSLESDQAFSKTAAYIEGQTGKTGYELSRIPNSSLGVVKFPVPKGGWVNLNDYLALLENAPGVQEVTPNFVRSGDGFRSPLQDPQSEKQWFLESINAEQAWAVHQDASNITVAVIDNAVMLDHEDLKGNLWYNSDEIPDNGVDDDKNGYIDDVNGWNFGNKNADPSPKGAECIDSAHGTHVAGAIGAVGGNGKGITGVSPKVKIMSLSIGRSQYGCGLDSAGIIAAIRYAVNNGAKIINMSLGGPGGSPLELQTLREASAKGVLVVVSAGNDGLPNDVEDIPKGSDALGVVYITDKGKKLYGWAPSYPAAFSRSVPGILTVANLEMQGSANSPLRLFNYGVSWQYVLNNVRIENGGISAAGQTKLSSGTYMMGSSYGSRSVQIGTPGTDIFSTVSKRSGNGVEASYAMKTGTSMASPITAGAAALVWSSFPDMTNIQIKERLLASVRKNSDLRGKVGSSGQLDLYEALCGDQFSRKADGCNGGAASTPAPPPAAKKPPPAQPEPAPKPAPEPAPEPEPRPAPEPKPAPKPAPKAKPTANDWLRGAEDDSAGGGIEW